MIHITSTLFHLLPSLIQQIKLLLPPSLVKSLEQMKDENYPLVTPEKMLGARMMDLGASLVLRRMGLLACSCLVFAIQCHFVKQKKIKDV